MTRRQTATALVTAALASAVLSGTQSPQPPPRPPMFTSRVDTVRVDVLVTDGGRPVRNLQASDFEVTDNGVRQRVESASFEAVPLNVVLALDMSDSVQGPLLDHLRAAGVSLLEALHPIDQAALITFAQAVSLRQRLTHDHGLLRAALDRPHGQGNTALVDAAFAGMLLGESDVGRALLIVFSDGRDTASWLQADAVLSTARRADVVAYTVSTSTGRANPFLDGLVHLTGGASYRAESTRDIGQAFTRALEEFRQRYLLGYTPEGVPAGGWHRLEVRVKGRRGLTVKSRPGYLSGAAVE